MHRVVSEEVRCVSATGRQLEGETIKPFSAQMISTQLRDALRV